MAKRYFLRFLLRDQVEDSIFEVLEQEISRLKLVLDDDNPRQRDDQFHWFDSIDGRSVIINLRFLQAVRYLWDPAEAPADLVRNEGTIDIWLRGRNEPLHEYTEDPDQLYDFFTNLEYGPGVIAFPKFDDEDGELIQFNPSEIIRVEAPAHLLAEGRRMIVEEDDGDA